MRLPGTKNSKTVSMIKILAQIVHRLLQSVFARAALLTLSANVLHSELSSMACDSETRPHTCRGCTCLLLHDCTSLCALRLSRMPAACQPDCCLRVPDKSHPQLLHLQQNQYVHNPCTFDRMSSALPYSPCWRHGEVSTKTTAVAVETVGVVSVAVRIVVQRQDYLEQARQ